MRARRIMIWLSLVGFGLAAVNAETWESLLAAIRKRFPAVRQLSTGDYADWISDANRAAPLLIDVRSAKEYAVSHLQHARRAESLKQIQALAPAKGRPIVLYCSVGYRSSALAQELVRAGYADVHNLEGSIFAWANEGRPVFRDGRQLDPPVVHPYDRKWGELLQRALWRFEP